MTPELLIDQNFLVNQKWRQFFAGKLFELPTQERLTFNGRSMVKTYESEFPPSPNIDKVTVSFDKLNKTDLFL